MFFEVSCAVCDERGSPVCAGCASRFRRLAHGQVVVDSPTPGWQVRAVFELEPNVRSLVAALKYRRERRLSRWVAGQLAPLVPRGADALTWVPATPARVRQRGFDQAEEIARHLSAATGVPAQRLLARADSDRRQTEQDRDQRKVGPSLSAARARPRRGQRHKQFPELVVLIDDVVTTGASLRSAAAVLADSGVQRVVPVVLAATRLRAEAWRRR